MASSRMIDAARDRWLARPDCPVAALLSGIEGRGKLRDAQMQAVKTYLFLKAGCGNKPLWQLYAQGAFNTLSPEQVDDMELPGGLRRAMRDDPGVCAVYEYLTSNDVDARQLLAQLSRDPHAVDPAAFFRELLGGVTYPDYLFSLPMGAGKTYLMAAFIYLDLYFQLVDPGNAAFARNFVVFAPSGLKSSVVPSLRTIERFDPEWLFPSEVAAQLRAMVTFDVLDERKSDAKSNRIKNPNVQKVAVHQPYEDQTGLVFVTNAEKVILDRVVVDDSGDLVLGEAPDAKTTVANELRSVIGKLPGLCVIIDEVHHAASEDIKLRAVVNGWVAGGCDVNGVLGFSGTPYLPARRKVQVTQEAGFKTSMLANVVFHYPLTGGIGNFLKRPEVDIVSGEWDDIVRAGVGEFLDRYGNLTYENGVTAKLAVFCSSVARLEEEVYPLVASLLAERGLSASELVLKYHRGGTGARRYVAPAEWEVEFAALDTPLSTKRIVLLVQIGKEGWDCRSLTGVVLSQEGDCAKNMVLQTSCRCLREVASARDETALIVVNQANARHLEDQLRSTQHADLASFQAGEPGLRVERHSRLSVLDDPLIEYRRFALSHSEVRIDPAEAEREAGFEAALAASRVALSLERVEGLDFEGVRRRESAPVRAAGMPMAFARWLRLLLTEAGPAPQALCDYACTPEGRERLRGVYERAAEPVEVAGAQEGDGARRLSASYDQAALRMRIRALFYPRRKVETTLEDVGEVAQARLVDEARLEPVYGVPRERFYPDEKKEHDILVADAGGVTVEVEVVVRQLRALGQIEAAEDFRCSQLGKQSPLNTYQYIPYRFDSPFEQGFYLYVMGLELVEQRGLEVYYNGDRRVADFRIECFARRGNAWRSVGLYTPDFLIVQRAGNGIGRVLMVETKGGGFEHEEGFEQRRAFMEDVFLPRNEEAFGPRRFSYAVLTDDVPEEQQRQGFEQLLEEFFAQ